MMNKIGLIASVLVYTYATFSAAQQEVVLTTPSWDQLQKNRQQELNNRVMDKVWHGGMSLEDAMISEGFDPSFFDSGVDNQQPNWGTEGYDIKDKTALLRAARHGGNVEVVKSLVKQGADVNYMDANRWSPLMAAIGGAWFDTIKFLVESGADVNARDLHEWTPLMLAVKDYKHETIRFLVDNGADINAKNSIGNTALILAAKNGDLESVELFVKKGADMNAKNNSGQTALSLAYETEIIEFLKKHGATK